MTDLHFGIITGLTLEENRQLAKPEQPMTTKMLILWAILQIS